ncbi:hypothetical protein L9F63_006025, partial [Diploptera punctata]
YLRYIMKGKREFLKYRHDRCSVILTDLFPNMAAHAWSEKHLIEKEAKLLKQMEKPKELTLRLETSTGRLNSHCRKIKDYDS